MPFLADLSLNVAANGLASYVQGNWLTFALFSVIAYLLRDRARNPPASAQGAPADEQNAWIVRVLDVLFYGSLVVVLGPLFAALVFAAATFGGVLALFIVVGALLFLGWALSVVYRVFKGDADAAA